MVLLVGSLFLLPLHGRLFRRLLPVLLIAVAITAGLAIYGANAQGIASADQFSDSATDSSTWMWRVNGWLSLLQGDDGNTATVLIGKSMGSGFWRVDPQTGSVATVQAHNEYVADYLRVGSIGLCLLLSLFIRPLTMLWRYTKIDPSEIYPSTSAWAVLIIVLLVYSITYSIDESIYPLLGIANSLMGRLRVAEMRAALVERQGWEPESMLGFADGTGGA
jgi:peptidoglycan/LPS O-acetylase OafA/YrhL